MHTMSAFSQGRRSKRRWVWSAAVGLVLLTVGCARPGPEPPSPTAPATPTASGPTPTAPATATVLQATATPAGASSSACPKDPNQWRLVEITSVRDPYGVPLYRIDPPCVYDSFWHDVTLHEFRAPDRPVVSKEKWVDIPWYWEPGAPIPQKPFKPFTPKVGKGFALYNRDWRWIDPIYTPYTTLRTGDPDFPMVIYLYEDYAGVAYYVQWDQGKIAYARPYSLVDGNILRAVMPWFYDVRMMRWFPVALRTEIVYPCFLRSERRDGSKLWEALGVKGFRRSELAQAFGLQEIFPERLDPKALKLRQDSRSIPPCEKGR